MKLEEKKVNKWSQKADVKSNVFPKDFFANKKSAEGYASGLLKYSDGNVGKAIKRATFYLNRAGGEVANKGAIKAAIKILEKRLEKEKTKKESIMYDSPEKYLAEKLENLVENEETLNDFTHYVDDETSIRVYDNGGETVDRYTAVMVGDKYKNPNKQGWTYMIGFNETPNSPNMGFWQHVEGQEGDHLGKLIKFESLPENIQKMLIDDTKKELEEKKLSPKEIEDLKDSEDDEEVEKIKRPEGSLRKGEKFGESITYDQRFLGNAERWLRESFEMNNEDLDESAFEHIAEKVKEGYVEGELIYEDDENSYRGWWKIKIEEDEIDEEIRNEEVARIIKTGIKRGYEPTFTLSTEWWSDKKDISILQKNQERISSMKSRMPVSRSNNRDDVELAQ